VTSIYADKVLVNGDIHTGGGLPATSLAILGERIALARARGLPDWCLHRPQDSVGRCRAGEGGPLPEGGGGDGLLRARIRHLL